MDPEKPTTHNSFIDALASSDVRGLAQKGRDVMHNQPPSEKSLVLQKEVASASNELSSSVDEIVEATLAVIGILQDQNSIMKTNHEDERLMMEILNGELAENRKANNLTRQLVWVSIIFSVISAVFTGMLVFRLQGVVQKQKINGDNMSNLASQFHDITDQIKASQEEIKESLRQQAVFTIKAPDNGNHGAIEIKQMVQDESGKMDTGKVIIPMNLKGAEVIQPGEDETPSLTAKKIRSIMKK